MTSLKPAMLQPLLLCRIHTAASRARCLAVVVEMVKFGLLPSEEMVKMVLSRPCHPEDQFTTSILRYWLSNHDNTLGEHIKTQLIKNNQNKETEMRTVSGYLLNSGCVSVLSLRRSSSKLAQLTLEQILDNLSNSKNSCQYTQAY
ncbi:integrator complex subunit 3-like isoform X2 [Micropterus dolomieu]|uniref:integrator complex subunit 3-like isoform X2 n=1 Tax=Micropterus dolomieu TaxID=147949 RepID=UPI001E8D9DF1|nr:integrator complex subunit 3-like isoform X2 [Micropterus dolomieu]